MKGVWNHDRRDLRATDHCGQRMTPRATPSKSVVVGFLDPTWPIPEMDREAGFDLGNGVTLITPPDWVRSEGILSDLDKRDRETVQRMAQLCLFVDVLAAEGGSRTPTWQVDRMLLVHRPSPYDGKIRQANLALWLSRASDVSVDVLLRIELYPDKAFPRRMTSVTSYHGNRFRPHRDDFGDAFTQEELMRARELNVRLSPALLERGAVEIAIRALWMALTMSEGNLRYVLLWVALEALFGSDVETTYKLATRMALFLAPERSAGECIRLWATRAYRARSKIVHGRGLDVTAELIHQTEQFTAEAIRRALLEPALGALFRGDRDEKLDSLMFRE